MTLQTKNFMSVIGCCEEYRNEHGSFILVFNQLDAQNLFYNKFYFTPLHVSSTCAQNM